MNIQFQDKNGEELKLGDTVLVERWYQNHGITDEKMLVKSGVEFNSDRTLYNIPLGEREIVDYFGRLAYMYDTVFIELVDEYSKQKDLLFFSKDPIQRLNNLVKIHRNK